MSGKYKYKYLSYSPTSQSPRSSDLTRTNGRRLRSKNTPFYDQLPPYYNLRRTATLPLADTIYMQNDLHSHSYKIQCPILTFQLSALPHHDPTTTPRPAYQHLAVGRLDREETLLSVAAVWTRPYTTTPPSSGSRLATGSILPNLGFHFSFTLLC